MSLAIGLGSTCIQTSFRATIMKPAMSVIIGLERLIEDESDCIRGKRLGLIANPTSVDRSLEHSANRLNDCSEARLVALFGPEHGLRGFAQDQIELDESPSKVRVRRARGPRNIGQNGTGLD